ncbi:hypothetical protein MBUL_04253 [Methylobacterium bullatum]|uniref:HTH-like domain-containing protein n=1 Tax=Methylobacterium bullatum TaxID=570505 RepID=A0A679JFS7_9HYPH|nr:hypothetical protein MBUL_04253 [Methylobacterium bullatum]
MLRQWRSALMEGSPPPRAAGLPGAAPASPVASPSDQAAEIARLRRELDRTRMERDVLKKRSASLRRWPSDVRFHRAACGRPKPVRLMCRVLEVSPSGYYGWRSRPESARSASNRQLLADVQRIHAGHHRRYGSPRVHAALWAEGRTASRGRVERLMRRHGIRALSGRRYRPCTTDSRHDLPIAPNLLKQQFSAARPNTVWLAEPKGRVAISPTCPPASAGSTWPPSSISPLARSSAGPCASTCGPN